MEQFLHAVLVFFNLEAATESFSAGISEGRLEILVLRCPGMRACYMEQRMNCSQSAPVPARAAGTARTVEVQDGRNKFADGNSQMAPQAAFEAGVILAAAEEVTDQLPENRAAAHELHHARSDGGAQTRAAIKTPYDARGKFQFRGKRGANPGGIFFGASFGEGFAQQFPGADGVRPSPVSGSTHAAASPMSAQFFPRTVRFERVCSCGDGNTWL